MVPLQPAPAAPDDGDGSASAEESDPPDDGTPGDEGEPQTPNGMDPADPEPTPPEPTPPEPTPPEPTPPEPTPPEPTPPGPPAFAPCPTDGRPCRIMPLGDSITFGIGAATPVADAGGYRVELFRQARADGHAILFVGTQTNGPPNVGDQPFPGGHEGYPGATINDGNNQLANRVNGSIAATDPDIILLMIGTNDVNGNVNNPPSDLGNLLDQITNDAPDALLVVAQIVPTRQAGTNARVQAYNATVATLVQEREAAGKHLALVDMFSPFVADANFATALLDDVLHPNDAGYVLMAQTWYAAIENVLP
jgi:lysophospholipase L1-like esterase